MKRHCSQREELAVHEAGHLIAIATTPGLTPGTFVWHRRASYEIAHVEPQRSAELDWENPGDRNALIARHAAVALAGGAAELVCATPAYRGSFDIRTIHAQVGRTDFELAHEWLTLQRYDPDQQTLEREIERLFREVFEAFDPPPMRAAIATVAERMLALLRDADAKGSLTLQVPAHVLLSGLELAQGADFTLQATLFDHGADARGGDRSA